MNWCSWKSRLVVISIIGILASLLLPALGRAKAKARSVQCLSNERHVTLSYKLALDEDTDSALDKPPALVWFVEHVGRPQEGWICPAAPLRTNRPVQLVGATIKGSVDSAWYELDWRRYYDLLSSYTGLPRPTEAQFRAGSYGLNCWLCSPFRVGGPITINVPYASEGQVVEPSLTPVLADAVVWLTFPRDVDFPAFDLAEGLGPDEYIRMQLLTITRHGSRPDRVPRSWPASEPLPGAINVGFFDGHVELVPLERLWQLHWHADYTPPAKRPGLP